MLKRVLRPWGQLLLALVVMAVGTILDGVVMVKMMGFVDYALAGDMDTLRQQIPMFLLQACLLVPIQLAGTIVKSWYRMDANLSMKRFYIRGVFRKNISEFQKENTANYISRLTNDCNTLDNNFVNGIFTVSVGITNFGVAVWILSTVSPAMVGLAVLVGGITSGVSILLSRPIQKQVKERSDQFDGYTSYIKEVLSAFHIVKCNDLQKKVTEDYNEKSRQIQNKWYVIQKVMTHINTMQNACFNGVFYLSICYLAYLATQGKMTASGALTVSQGMQRMMWPLMMMSEALPNLISSKKLGEKMDDSLVNKNDYEETLSMESFEDKMELIDVGFAYEDADQGVLTLQDVNMEFKKGGKYLIVGPSGGGKSTLLKLLRKYHSVTQGELLLDGKPLKDIKKEEYYAAISNVEQQVFIFEDTLRNNITLYKEYSEARIWEALRAAGLERFVRELQDGLETMIYENGKNISGGERSRVVIARAFLSDASILFLDEAFAALDLDRAREIEQTILNLKSMTVINVSHVVFKDTIDQYDRVYHVKGTVW